MDNNAYLVDRTNQILQDRINMGLTMGGAAKKKKAGTRACYSNITGNRITRSVKRGAKKCPKGSSHTKTRANHQMIMNSMSPYASFGVQPSFGVQSNFGIVPKQVQTMYPSFGVNNGYNVSQFAPLKTLAQTRKANAVAAKKQNNILKTLINQGYNPYSTGFASPSNINTNLFNTYQPTQPQIPSTGNPLATLRQQPKSFENSLANALEQTVKAQGVMAGDMFDDYSIGGCCPACMGAGCECCDGAGVIGGIVCRRGKKGRGKKVKVAARAKRCPVGSRQVAYGSKKSGKKTNKWIKHVKATAKKNHISYGEALSSGLASDTYRG